MAKGNAKNYNAKINNMYYGTYRLSNKIVPLFPLKDKDLKSLINKLILLVISESKPKENAEWFIYNGEPSKFNCIGRGGRNSDGKDWCEFI